jgi:hypothetical protein
MKNKLTILYMILSLTVLIIAIGSPIQTYADDSEQPAQGRPVIDSRLEEMLADMSPTDNISVLVYLRGDPNLDWQIRAIWQGQPDDEMRRISDNLMQQLRKVSAEMYPYEQQLRAGDPDAIKRYKELMEKYGTDDSTRAAVQRLTELHDAKNSQIASLEEQAYSALHKQVIQAIEQLPNTKVTSSNFLFNSLVVQTKAGNIQALAAMPEVVQIGYNSTGITCITPYLGLALLSPGNGSTSNAVKQITFSWKPFEETTKYEIILAKDPGLTQIIKQDQTTTTTYQYDGTLDYNTNYFWQVKGIEPPSDPSATFSFQTEAAPTPKVEPQPIVWNPMLILLIMVALVASAVLITFFVTKGNKPN